MHLKIEFNVDNAQFHPYFELNNEGLSQIEIANQLERIATYIRLQGIVEETEYPIHDLNGNTIGEWCLYV